jgi:hypothetical protein
MNKLIIQLPHDLQNKIFFYAAQHPTSVIFNNYKQKILSNIDTDRSYDFDYYMINPNRIIPIPYSYYRDITYNLFNTAHIQNKARPRNKSILHFHVQ